MDTTLSPQQEQILEGLVAKQLKNIITVNKKTTTPVSNVRILTAEYALGYMQSQPIDWSDMKEFLAKTIEASMQETRDVNTVTAIKDTIISIHFYAKGIHDTLIANN